MNVCIGLACACLRVQIHHLKWLDKINVLLGTTGYMGLFVFTYAKPKLQIYSMGFQMGRGHFQGRKSHPGGTELSDVNDNDFLSKMMMAGVPGTCNLHVQYENRIYGSRYSVVTINLQYAGKYKNCHNSCLKFIFIVGIF